MPSRTPELGTTIITARAARRWTQDDLAERMGVRRQAVALWEAGQRPSDANLAELRALLGPDIWTMPERPPARITAADAHGVRYAALMMSETVTRLLREAVEAEERGRADPAAAITAATRRAADAARTPPLQLESAPIATGPTGRGTRRRRRTDASE